MSAPSFVPRIAEDAGIGERYRYWTGRSGRRYLFTRTERASLPEFENALAIAVDSGRIVWAGDAAAFAVLPAPPLRCELFVHLLASSPDDRAGALADLRPAALLALAA
jgi:hypothetical protein